MIKVQMRIDDVIDVIEAPSSSLKPLDKIRLHVVPTLHRNPLLPIPDTWTNDDLMAGDDDQETLHQSPQETTLVDEIGSQPRCTRNVSKIKFRNKPLKRCCGIQLSDAEHRGITDLPAQSLHLVTVPWLPQTGRMSRIVTASLVDREGPVGCSTGAPVEWFSRTRIGARAASRLSRHDFARSQ